MGYKFRADGTIGRVAIYEDSDDAPWDNPLTYKARVLFHSGLRYPARVATMSGTLVLPARAGGLPVSVRTQTHDLGAHGLGFIPMVEGLWTNIPEATGSVPIIGSIPVQRGAFGALTSAGYPAMHRWMTVGADATNVYAHEMWGVANGNNISALNLNYEIYLFEVVGLT